MKRWITLSVSAHGMKIIDKRGLARVVAEMRAAGEKV
jgi:large subunit ribosomal protein L28